MESLQSGRDFFTLFYFFRDLFGLPHIEISGMSLSQSIEAPLTNKDTAILSGGFVEIVQYLIFWSKRVLIFVITSWITTLHLRCECNVSYRPTYNSRQSIGNHAIVWSVRELFTLIVCLKLKEKKKFPSLLILTFTSELLFPFQCSYITSLSFVPSFVLYLLNPFIFGTELFLFLSYALRKFR